MVLIGSGLRDLDLLLGGGFIRDSPVLLLTETGTMGELLPLQIINHRVQEGDYGFILDLDFPPVRIREWFKFFNWDLEKMGVSSSWTVSPTCTASCLRMKRT